MQAKESIIFLPHSLLGQVSRHSRVKSTNRKIVTESYISIQGLADTCGLRGRIEAIVAIAILELYPPSACCTEYTASSKKLREPSFRERKLNGAKNVGFENDAE